MKESKSLRLFQIFDKCVSTCLFVIVMAMIVIGSMQVIWRYVLQNSLSWSEESMRYMYVWLTLIGISLGIRRRQFTSIDAIANVLKNKFKNATKVLFVITFLIQIAFFILLIVYGWEFALANMNARSTALRVSMGVMYMAFPIGGVIGILYSVITAIDIYNATKQNGEKTV